MASIKRKEKKNGEIVYRIDISLRSDIPGKKKVKVITFKPNQNSTPKQQEKEAQKFALEWEEKLKNGDTYDGEFITFKDYSEKWLEYIRKNIAYSTYESYVHIVNNKIVPFLGTYKLAKIKHL